MADIDGEPVWESKRPGLLRRIGGWFGRRHPVTLVVLALHLAAIGAVLTIVVVDDLNPSPVVRRERATECRPVRGDDDLMHLALRRSEAAARGQIDRWQRCDPTTLERASKALDRDRLFIVAIGGGLAVAVLYTRLTRMRWRRAAELSAVLGALYVIADVAENRLLRDFLEDPDQWTEWIRRWATVKLGAVIGAVPIFLISLALCVSTRRRPPTAAPGTQAVEKLPTPSPAEAAKRFAQRCAARVTGNYVQGGEEAGQETDHLPDALGMGICCSGGGVRSAAFNLGALQALDDPETLAGRERELTRAKWLSAVSGGSYIAAAWVTARAPRPDGTTRDDAWRRNSPDELHLRHNASYLAPGLGGKLWGFARFLFGFVLNIGVVTLLIGVVSLPFGWFVARYEERKPIDPGGVITLPRGGCLQTPEGGSFVALPGARLTLADPGRVRLDPTAPPEPPVSQGEAGKGEAVTAGPPPASVGPPVAPPCPPPPEPAEKAEVLPAAAPGRMLRKGTRVQLQVIRPLRVGGDGVAGCELVGNRAECSASNARILSTSPGTRLVSAPEASLVLEHRAVADKGNQLARPCGAHRCEGYHAPTFLSWPMGVLGGLTLYVGLGLVMAATSANTTKAVERWARRLFPLALLAATVVYILPAVVAWAENGRWWFEDKVATAAAGGVVALLVALVAQVAPFIGAAPAAAGGVAGKALGAAKRVGRALRPLLIRLAGAVAGPLLVALIGVGFASYAAQHGADIGQIALWLALAGPLGVVLAGADLNEWSLHPFYRDRLRWGYAVDPVKQPPDDPREDPLQQLPDQQPELLICAALNLADRYVTAPGRPVAPWVFGRQEVGSTVLAAAPSRVTSQRKGTVSPSELATFNERMAWTWTAVAVSGAAFSPAMGKMGRPERFLLALGNLRLGVWYPNPRFLNDPDERKWYATHHPRPVHLAKEALGLHRADDRWVYVTDGGHYENLGLVELLRRRCSEVYCFDASGDTPDTFGTLADAMRLAREEMEIEIVFDPTPLKPNDDGISPIGVWAGVIRYQDGARGWLVLAKLAVPMTAPFDIIDLARTLPAFPNHPTADQLYTDQKFEAYRALGFHLGQQAAELGSEIRALMGAGQIVEDAVRNATERRRPPARDPRPRANDDAGAAAG